VTVVRPLEGGFEGTVHPDDEEKLYLAGVTECPPGYVSFFQDNSVTREKEFGEERWEKWITRDEGRKKKMR
jgi:hypothetical protein